MNTPQEFALKDIIELQQTSTKKNYDAVYKPRNFWEEYGRYYLRSFVADRKGSKRSFDLNMQPLVARIRYIQPETVLEVGCGFGRCIPFVISNVDSIKKLTGLEFSSTMIENSKLHLKHYPQKDRVEIVNGNAKDIPFEGKSFDLTYTHVCLTHIPPEDIPKVTAEISRVTKKWIIHIERFKFPYEHPNPHRWSHLLAPYYLNLGWEIHECDIINREHCTIALVLKSKNP